MKGHTDHPFISAVVCTYNRDQVLPDSLSSILAQDYTGPWELIPVDQTREHTSAVSAFLQGNCRRIRLVAQAEPNLPRARNRGFQAAKGDLVLFSDDDIVLPHDVLRRFAACFSPGRIQAVGGVPISEREPDESLKVLVRQYGRAVLSQQPGMLRARRHAASPLCLSAQAFRSIGGYDENLGVLTPTAYGEDEDFCHRLVNAGVPLFVERSIRVIHRDHFPGGCGSRRIDPRLARRYRVVSMAYRNVKYHGRLGLRGWARILRGYVLNREGLREGFGEVLDRFRLARSAVTDARVAWDRHVACCASWQRTDECGF